MDSLAQHQVGDKSKAKVKALLQYKGHIYLRFLSTANENIVCRLFDPKDVIPS